ncbi:MAG: PTS sugar transporter subunit IIA [Spirochaetaceae bacterium]|jgi:PTS system nitrogen regulatory IIA component|nr:PTS sugar transporter subunit IIA [Spirochaetaceae bacterium]
MDGREQKKKESEGGLIPLLKRGGIVSGVTGTNPGEVLARLIETVHSPAIDRDRLLSAVLEREALMSTAAGHGVALPHPRNPQVKEPDEQFVTIAYLDKPVDWNSLDRAPVHTAILIVSASPKLHLYSLSQLNFFCQQEQFRALLENRASLDEIVAVIQAAEQAW